MGTNFYLATTSKEARDEYFGYDYELMDEPIWAWRIHIAKTSCGWLPLFQSHNCFKAVWQLKLLYDTGKFKIFDEYGDEYNWEQFDERVIKFNGGVKGVQPRVKIENTPRSPFYDPRMPEEMPVSHLDYRHAYGYENDYFTDEHGYEFTYHEFS